MAIRNASDIDRGFANLAQMFAPPSAGDLAGYARARLANTQADQLGWLFANPNDPTASNRAALVGVQGYGNTPAGFTYNVDQNNATSRANNAADNARAIQQTNLQQAGETTRTMLAPVAAGATRFVPPTIADMYSVPPQQVGVISASPGERVFTPGGATFEGGPKPLTKSEVEGAILQGMPQDQQRAVVAGNPPAQTNAVAVLPDGSRIPAIQDRATGRWKEAQTGNDLPNGIQIFDMPKPQGTATEVGFAPTTANMTDANKQEATLRAVNADLDAAQALLQQNPGIAGLPGQIRGTLQNIASSAGELSAAFGNLQPDAKITLDEAQQAIQRIVPSRDPAIQQYALLQARLAYGWAQLNNPTGEVSREAYQRALEAISGGFFANNQSALEGIAAMRDQAARLQREYVGTLRNPGQPTPPPAPADDLPTVSTPEEARALGSGKRFRDPQGNIRVVP